MSSNTEQLNLLKVDPVTDSQQYFNVDTMLNANWDKVDSFAGQIADKVDDDLLPRLNTAATTELILKPGTQTINVARNTPFNFSGMSGRMLLNLLGRNGNCESLTGWTFSGTATLNTANVATGAASIQITSNSNVGIMSRNVELKVGATYILAASIKLGTASGAAVSVTTIANGSLATSASDFTTSYMRFTATSSVHSIAVVTQATQGQTAYVDAIRLYEISAAEYTQLGNMTGTDVERVYPYTEGLAGVKNPYAIRWTSAAKTDVAALLAFDTELLAAPVPASDSDRDRLEQGADGQYYKTSAWAKLTDLQSRNWTATYAAPGVKSVYTPVLPSSDSNIKIYSIKYDGKMIDNIANGSVADRVWFGGTGAINMSLSSVDTGWGDSYTPTADEVRAYFNGWTMFNADSRQGVNSPYHPDNPANNLYNGTGLKAWARRLDGTSRIWVEGTSVLPMTKAPNYTSYELIYKRVTAVTEPCVYEGALSLVQGDNVIQVGTGLVLRESVKPLLYPESMDRYMINYQAAGGSTNPLRFNPAGVLAVYQDDRKASINWGITPDKVTWQNGVYIDWIDSYNPEKSYTASYFRADKYPIAMMNSSIPANERAMLDDLIRDVQQTTRRVSVVEFKKIDQDNAIWFTPTLLNGWVNTSGRQPLQYRKKDSVVMLRGEIKSGAVGAPIFRLPDGYRPKSTAKYAVNCWNGSAVVGASLIIYPTGEAIISDGNNNEIGLGTIIFTTD
ncbi:hypothetical protein [Paenibacillus campi]|uniref:hypothetical protein n=1 Tax=Paenibacillus campi TaxID=3106031 RepID=UPI002AFEEB4D|nr:hypothetical protein [Paenibacillus sp. SGZ-1014]